MSVKRIVHLEGTVTLHNEDVDTSPRGWSEGSVHYVDIVRHDFEHLLVTDSNGLKMLVSETLIAEALELFNDED